MKGRIGIYQEWLTDEKLLLIQQWAEDGLTDAQIAESIGIRPETFCRWKAKYNQLSQSIKKGREVANYMVENALYNSALNGNTTAMIFWLKNRCPDKWRDRPIAVTKDNRIDELIVALNKYD